MYLSEDLETMTNPMLYKNGVKSFEFYSHKRCINLSSIFISNIWEIKPESIWIKTKRFKCNSESDFFEILKNFPKKMQITFGEGDWDKSVSLSFINTTLKIFQVDKNEFWYFKWKSFIFEFDQKYINDIKFEYLDSDKSSDWLLLSFEYYDKITFEDFDIIIDQNQIEEYNSYFPILTSDSNNKGTIVVLAKNLDKVNLHSSIVSLVGSHNTAKWLTYKLWELASFSHRLELPRDFEYLNKIINLFPQNSKYTLIIHLNGIQL